MTHLLALSVLTLRVIMFFECKLSNRDLLVLNSLIFGFELEESEVVGLDASLLKLNDFGLCDGEQLSPLGVRVKEFFESSPQTLTVRSVQNNDVKLFRLDYSSDMGFVQSPLTPTEFVVSFGTLGHGVQRLAKYLFPVPSSACAEDAIEVPGSFLDAIRSFDSEFLQTYLNSVYGNTDDDSTEPHGWRLDLLAIQDAGGAFASSAGLLSLLTSGNCVRLLTVDDKGTGRFLNTDGIGVWLNVTSLLFG
ncbi:MAG: hypothetical protein Q3999_04025 [Buchananella hordeovulneris]|nr:hypothetical protein [Buchananella hordeovulneris]